MTLTFPDWCRELRPHQVDAVANITAAFDTQDIVILDAPTGSGKTLIGELVRQLVSPGCLYLCSSLSLQDQFVHDFPYAVLLRGRSNYATADYPERFNTRGVPISAADCDKQVVRLPHCEGCSGSDAPPTLHCRWCHPVRLCPYEQAKATAIRSPLVCTNTYYFLYEANYQGAMSGRGLVIVDEADTLESILLQVLQVHISQRKVKQHDLTLPGRKTVEASWAEWAEETGHTLRGKIQRALDNKKGKDDIRTGKLVVELQRLAADISRLNHPDTGINAGGWIYTNYDRGDVTFKPLSVAPFAHEYLWRHATKWLLMSSTIISSQVMMASLGV